MSLIKQNSYVGNGTVFLQLRGVAGAKMVPIGNCEELNTNVEVDQKTLLDSSSSGGGALETLDRIKSVKVQMKVTNLSSANIAIALRASVTSSASAAVADEAHADIALGSLIRLARLPDLTAAITVKKGATVIPSAGNWTAIGAGIWPSPEATGLLDGDDITVSYTALASDMLQTLVQSANEYRLIFSGMNEAREDKPTVATMHRLKFAPASLGLITDDFGRLQLDAELLSDPTVVGTGLSKFMLIEMAQAA